MIISSRVPFAFCFPGLDPVPVNHALFLVTIFHRIDEIIAGCSLLIFSVSHTLSFDKQMIMSIDSDVLEV